MNLLVDIGNSRVKWGWQTDGGIAHAGQLIHRVEQGEIAVGLSPLIDRINSNPERVLVSNVAGPEFGQKLKQWCRDAGVDAEFIRVESDQFGLRVAYKDPASLGVDRWLAMVAAKQRNRKPFCVIDVGTAMTIDAVDSDGTHLGGTISPGVFLMKESLLKKTADIHYGEDGVGSIFANNTGDAVASGAWYAMASLADRAAYELEKRVGVAPRVFLTGGDGELVAKLMKSRTKYCPDLVLLGLAVCAKVRSL